MYEVSKQFIWPYTRRVRTRADFLLCYDANNRFFSKYFVLFVRKQEGKAWRVGFTVSRKMGNAVRRNKIKRVLREFFRLHGQAMPCGLDVVVVPKRNLLNIPITYDLVKAELSPLLKKIVAFRENMA